MLLRSLFRLLLLHPLAGCVLGMFFTTNDTHPTWDTWSFFEAGLPQGPYFEFYLASQRSTGTWSGFGVASSPDGVHWVDHGLVITRDANATGGYLGTGSVWRAPPRATFKYVVNYSQQYGAPREQHIFFAVSNDLVSWQRLGWADVFVVNASAGYTDGRWDCIYAVDDPSLPGTGAKLGWWTTVPTNRSGFGFGASRDGVHWVALPPPLLLGGPRVDVEIGAVEALPGGAGRYFAMVGAGGQMLTYTAAAPGGPFSLAAVNPTLLGFQTSATTYFTRFFPTAPGPHTLVTHQWISRGSTWFGRRCFLPPLKAAVVDGSGVLRLAWWPGNEAARGGALALAPEPFLGDVALWEGAFNVTQGVIVEVDVNTTSVAAFGGAGLFVQTADGGGVAALVATASGAGAFGPVSGSGGAFKPEEAWDRALALPPGAVARVRVLLRLEMMEMYVNDVLISTYACAAFPTGRLGLLDPAATVAGAAAVTRAAAWAMTLPGAGLAYRAPALASSVYQPGGDTYAADRATDGDPSSRWSSGLPYNSSTAWLRVDLASPQRVGSVVVKWEESVAFASAYSVGCSADGAAWTTLFSTESGQGGVETIGGLDAVCRFVILNCTRTGPENGYSVYELEVHPPVT